ncbi:putative membrane protein [Curtobacterium pusillum]|uniref:Membrane protein n=1 Tax=Curtobacterium pusillum TaxID=69373 RepID=A0AAW3T0D6_9MICO|nr:DUF2127 domain-containing protein [Curtobacterium pusillum]MBA8988896.1 putative membrane protein [Curtobacterium pusillum]
MNERTWSRGRVLDLVFLLGIALKGLDGAVELLLGLPLLVLRPAQVLGIARALTAGELREDPHDLLAHVLLHGAASLSADATVVAAVYLVVHGAVKLGILAALFRGTARVYPWAIVALSGFLVWQGYQLATGPTVGIAALTVFDAVVIALTWREWRRHRGLRDAWRSVVGRAAAPSAPPARDDTAALVRPTRVSRGS